MLSRWCLCLGSKNQDPPYQQSTTSRTGLFSISAAAEEAEHRMFFFDNRNKSCKQLLRQNGLPSKVILFPDESWARNACSSHWTVTPFWWSQSMCKIVEVTGSRRYSTRGKMVDTGPGTLNILGSFKKQNVDPDFKLYLTSNVARSDFNMGYSMTGTLERGSLKKNKFEMTHFAIIRRRDFVEAMEQSSP
ncbi:hypothetical protein HCN44_009169 [Aphidius gifuensis]|uniref:Uncharacterized protein n=1 Tax=Aphidius gifuensis TaxID=684658 RepID=A0A834Y744_APHGI|nr:uncharacterized protein LOC122857751 [Aphidius gifuensis]XP_044016038.1 uncharacterized protein LOC122857751 [Aphidius gifuensis]XP_044016049.1 uncharacterized protein LOC122857751 [Aphidius gifuensis]KAF7997771.1 hypothetical protein HCN44_009169 [Aphidius gifuensis]